MVNVISAYAPQVGCEGNEKEEFWPYIELYKGCTGVQDCRCDHGDDEVDFVHRRLKLFLLQVCLLSFGRDLDIS